MSLLIAFTAFTAGVAVGYLFTDEVYRAFLWLRSWHY